MALYVALLAGAAGLGAASFWGSRRSKGAGIALAAVALLLLCGKAVLHAKPHWEWALFPWPGYAYLQSFVLYPIAACFFGMAAARLPVTWNRVVIALVGLLVIVHGARENSWIAWPETHGNARYVDAAHHIEQSTHYTCGPCACLSAVSYCDIRLTEREMARLCLTRENGSRLFSLYRGIQLALADQPYRVSIRDVRTTDLLSAGTLAVISQGKRHAVCLVGQGRRVKVHDPLQAEPVYWDPTQLEKARGGPAVIIE